MDWKLLLIISFRESAERKPPEEMTVIAKLRLSRILMPDIKKIEKIKTVKSE